MLIGDLTKEVIEAYLIQEKPCKYRQSFKRVLKCSWEISLKRL